MKKIAQILALLLAVSALTSCGDPKLLSIIPAYMGGTVTSTRHEFTKDDFYVLATYDDGTDKQVTDFEFEVVGMEDGYYEINISYEDMDNPVFVPIELKIYPSDLKNDTSEETKAE